MKVVVRDWARQELRPARIWQSVLQRFRLNESTEPALSVVQRFVHHYISSELGGSDVMATVRRAVQDAGFTGKEDETDAFTFAWRTDGAGMSVVGNGSDADPFVLGISTKNLLRQADRNPSTFVLHVDATYKLAQVGYPVIAVGITDRARRFHLLAMFIVSHQQQPQFTEVPRCWPECFRRLLENNSAWHGQWVTPMTPSGIDCKKSLGVVMALSKS
ncbi:unnamed protein product [Phytophthora lilii]|uniref:Unnamed protein product n=1 Tax=Phytophthora lilii TaxID=2077276 RepID=A0A9W6XEM2_9STRA|nr:unnamed protein product [Phytophthora lilii]